MPKYLIERNLPGASGLSSEQLRHIAETSMCAMEHLPSYHWEKSYIVGDTILCVHEAKDEETIREHSRRGGFPVTRISRIDGEITSSMARPKKPVARPAESARTPQPVGSGRD